MTVAVAPTTAEAAAVPVTNDDSFRQFMLSSLACASLRARLLQNEIDAIGIALKNNLMTADTAVAAIEEINFPDLFPMMRQQ